MRSNIYYNFGTSASSKRVKIPLAAHFILSKTQCPINQIEVVKMEKYPYANLIGSLMFVMICTRPDLAYAMSLLSRYMYNLGYEHWLALKHVVNYIANTLDVGLVYKNWTGEWNLVGFVDANFAAYKGLKEVHNSLLLHLGTQLCDLEVTDSACGGSVHNRS